jgi:hypothetical protein
LLLARQDLLAPETLQGLMEAIHILFLLALSKVAAAAVLERLELTLVTAAAMGGQLLAPEQIFLIGLAAAEPVATRVTAATAQSMQHLLG